MEADVRRSCASGLRRPASRSRPSTRARTTTSTWTGSRGRTAPGRSWPPGASRCPRATRRIPPTPRPSTGSATARTLLLEMIRDHGVEPYEGSVRYVRAARDAGLRRAVVSSSANCRDVLVAAGIDDLFEARIDGIVAEREHLRGKPAPDTFLAGAKALGLAPARGRGVRGRPGRGGGGPGRAASATSWGWTASGRRTALKAPRRRRRRRGSRRAAGPLMIRQSTFRSSRGPCGRQAGPDLLAQTESVFALSNGHIGLARQPGRGGAARPAGDLPQRGLRAAPAALRRGRLRLSRSPGRPSST